MNSTPEATPLPDGAPERRLHPLSWLFVLIQQLKQFIVPIVVLLVFNRGDTYELWGLVAVGVLALVSIWQYFTYRFRIAEDWLEIRSGLLERSLRQIPFTRINNVALHQTLLHRVFGVAEVRLESAGGVKPEAEMRVLALADAEALEAIVRRGRRRAQAAQPDGTEAADAPGHVLLALDTADVIRVGLISNRGMILIGGAFAGISQFAGGALVDVLEDYGREAFGLVSTYGKGHEVLAAALLVVMFLVVVRVFSIALALLQYSGFRLEEHGRRLTVERGLLTRTRTSTPRRRIQAWTLRETLLHRLFKRRTLEVATAVMDNNADQQPRTLRELAPVATPEACDALVRHLAPRMQWPLQDWTRLHRSQAVRLFLPQLLVAAILVATLGRYFGVVGAVIGALWVPWSAWLAWHDARHAGWAFDGTTIAVRRGWWSRTWRMAEIGKVQALRMTRSPVDRWCGTATLLLDTAGGSAIGDPLQMRFLPVADAERLMATLSADVARRPLRW